ncbi:spore coat putative kinase YutH [Lederbergia lenta]|uniref:spore coat putative kinase YutH n=1 Tax=Lederbergia lenta TaxID=1467 RepID=UPI00203F0341|nr:spore coat protein YutH [Lederbergia lenta]MCM3112947.1 spore coat protein YutH [Lederbergia lenta]
MSMEILEKYYEIKPESSIQDGNITRYMKNDSIYTIVPVTHVEQETLIELYEISEHMAKYQDKKVSRFVAQAEGKFLITHEEQDYVLLKNTKRKSGSQKNVGRMLAKFHERGKEIQIQISSINRIGQWKEYWITRLEQLERAWHAAVQEKPEEEFEKLFIESFPYYLGLCENAIQYVTDTEMDLVPQYSDRGTICHERFHDNLWKESLEIRNPFDWVFDHCGRDIAEWVRGCYFRQPRSFQPEMIHFLQGYQSIITITEFSWRLIYARLLFPLHYFSCIEEYYSAETQSKQKHLEEKMRRYIRDSGEYELFLKHFYKIAGADTKRIPIIDWI